MPLILPQRKSLAYPARCNARFDPNHPAANGIGYRHGYSAVAKPGGALLNLLTGTLDPPSLPGTALIPFDANVGACVRNTSASNFSIAGNATTADTSVTIAAIIRYQTGTGAIFSSSSNGNGVEFYINADQLKAFATSANPASGFTLNNNEAYFVAYSDNNSISNFVAKSLQTGKLFFSTGVSAAPVASNGTYQVGADIFGNYADFPIAAVSFTPSYLSMDQLRQWAEDPWAFWYPPTPRKVSYFYNPTPDTTTTNGVRLRQRWNRPSLAYPSGAVAGIDPSHPASFGLAISAVAVGPNAVNLVNATSGTPTAVSASIDGSIGPSISKSVSMAFTSFTATSATLAAICVTASSHPATRQNIVSASGTNDLLLFLESTTGELQLYNEAGFLTTGINFAVSTPYFVAVTLAGAVAYFVVKNLKTGAVFQATVSGSSHQVGTTPFYLGNDQYGQSFNGLIAAGAYSRAVMTITQLLQWAEDPWAFWYPRQTQRLIVPVATPIITATQYAAFCTPQRDGAVYTQMTGY